MIHQALHGITLFKVGLGLASGLSLGVASGLTAFLLVDLVGMSPTVATIITIGVVATPLGAFYNSWAQRSASRKQALEAKQLAERQALEAKQAAELVAEKVEEARKFQEAVAQALAQAQSEVAQKVEGTRVALAASTKEADSKLDQIHVMVNSRMSEAVATIAEMKLTIAGLERLLGVIARSAPPPPPPTTP